MSRAVSQWVETLETRRLFASVVTDTDDYAFGATAQITGSGFQAGETVQFQVTHAEGTQGSNEHTQNEAWLVTDGGVGDLDGTADGNIQTTWLVDDPDAVGATYVLTATGLTSGEIATARFTDGTISNFTIFDLTPDNAAPGAAKVPVFGFQVKSTHSGAVNKFDIIELTFTGTNIVRDIARLHLYYREFPDSVSGPSGTTFDLGLSTRIDVVNAQEFDVPKADGSSNKMVLKPTPDKFPLASSTKWYQFYVVADIANTALGGDQVDFKVLDKEKIVFEASSGTKVYPATAAAGDPAGNTTIQAANAAPAITLPGGALNYTENGPAAVIDGGATASDSDSANFDTGKLTVDFTANGSPDDRLAIRNQGTGAGQIGVSGSNVTFGGTTIGAFTGGIGTTPLVITFSANSSPAAAQALMRNITFANVSDTPSTAARTVRFVLTDGDGGTSNAATKTINVVAANDAPAVAANSAAVGVNEGQTAQNTGTYSDVDGGNVSITASVGTIVKTGTTSGTWSLVARHD
jgi:hypothetical protein